MTRPMTPPTGSSRINLQSMITGFALGAVVASFAWVQILPNAIGGNGGSGAEEFVFVPGDQVPTQPAEGDDQTASGPERRVIQSGGGEGGGSGEGPAQGGIDVTGGGGDAGSGSSSGGESSGISGDRIKLGATVAEDGIAKAFLGEVRLGIEAVRNRVNRGGGIHGRQLDIVYKNDAWDPTRGREFIENLIRDEKVFAFAVSPSSEGLNTASHAGLFEKNQVPVVGADGLNNTQFSDPWIWPVAAATTTQVHIILDEAYKRCESNSGCKGNFAPAIVFGSTYRFGVEGSFAFNGAYCRAQGGTVKSDGNCNDADKNIPGFEPGGKACNKGTRFCGIDATKGQYTSEIQTVRDACKPQGDLPACNFVLLLLEPATALAWMGAFDSANTFERSDAGGCCGMTGAQPLFTSNFGVECKTKCHGMTVWSGYNPPLGRYANEQAVADYVRELKAQSSTADEYNQFTLGGYIGMTLLVEALEKVGPELTREKLVQTLNSMDPLKTGLTAPQGLQWTAERRYANRFAQGFEIDYTDRFNRWKQVSGYREDPWAGQDNKLP